jgi:hypothetical protein
MSDQPAAIRGTFADFRLIKGRKVAQLVVELPIEEADAALATLGGLPQPAAERWVALAALNVTSIKPQEKRRFEELKSAMQAGIRCSVPAFWRFIGENFTFRAAPVSEEDAADFVRKYCGVSSRSALNLDPKAAAKWQELDARYMLWLREPQHA